MTRKVHPRNEQSLNESQNNGSLVFVHTGIETTVWFGSTLVTDMPLYYRPLRTQ